VEQRSFYAGQCRHLYVGHLAGHPDTNEYRENPNNEVAGAGKINPPSGKP